jgi:hypothetical protein
LGRASYASNHDQSEKDGAHTIGLVFVCATDNVSSEAQQFTMFFSL